MSSSAQTNTSSHTPKSLVAEVSQLRKGCALPDSVGGDSAVAGRANAKKSTGSILRFIFIFKPQRQREATGISFHLRCNRH